MSEPFSASLLAPALGPSPNDEERPWSPPPATPGVLYRSFFARECDDIVLQLGQGGGRGCGTGRAPPTPGQRAVTVEAETLTPLEASWSFMTDPLPGSSEKPPPSPHPAPPSPSNRTYVREPSLCEASVPLSSEGLTFTRLEDTLEDRRRTFELVPIEASTPLRDFFPPPPELQQEEATRPPRPSLRRAVLRARLSPLQGGPGRKRLAAVPISKAASTQGGPGKRSSLTGSSPANTARQESAGAPAAKGQMPGKRTGPVELPSNKTAVQPSSIPRRQPGFQSSLTSSGSKLPVRAAHSEKPACGVLLNAGQIPRTTLPSRPAAPCPQCHQLIKVNRKLIKENQKLIEDNRRLNSMMEGRKEITAETKETVHGEN